jgi:hypothetical protein
MKIAKARNAHASTVVIQSLENGAHARERCSMHNFAHANSIGCEEWGPCS